MPYILTNTVEDTWTYIKTLCPSCKHNTCSDAYKTKQIIMYKRIQIVTQIQAHLLIQQKHERQFNFKN